MARIQCPNCDSKFEADGSWASAALSALMPAPAIPDMATQVRCPNCTHLFAHGEIRHMSEPYSQGSLALGLLGLALLFVWLSR